MSKPEREELRLQVMLDDGLVRALDWLCRIEDRTRSSVVRDAIRKRARAANYPGRLDDGLDDTIDDAKETE